MVLDLLLRLEEACWLVFIGILVYFYLIFWSSDFLNMAPNTLLLYRFVWIWRKYTLYLLLQPLKTFAGFSKI